MISNVLAESSTVRREFSIVRPRSGTAPLPPSLVKEGRIAQETFDCFMSWLDPDREAAGVRYEMIRRKLIMFFACRGCACAEEYADETINRVILKAPALRESYKGDPAHYFCGVARNVWKELYKHRPAVAPPPAPDPVDLGDERLDCLEECMAHLSVKSRELILNYYAADRPARITCRGKLARLLGIDRNALRVRVHRLRAHLQVCATECLRRKGIDP